MKSALGIKIEFSSQSQMNWKPKLNQWHTEGMGWFKYYDKDEVVSPHYYILGKALYEDIKGPEDKFWTAENTCEYSYEGQSFKLQIKVHNQPGYTEVKFKINNLKNK